MRGDNRDHTRYLSLTNIPCHVATLDRDRVLATIGDLRMCNDDLSMPGDSLQRGSVVNINALVQRQPGHCPVHRSGVDVEIAQSLGQLLTYSTFSRASRPIDSNTSRPSHESSTRQ